MAVAPEKPAVPLAEFRRAWRLVTFAGALGATWGAICIGSPLRTKFLIELGATPEHINLIAALCSLALVFQLFGGIWTNHVRKRKGPWMALIILHRLLFLAVLAAPVLFVNNSAFRLWWMIGVLFLHDSIMNFATPLWTSWMADLVPTGSMSRNWAARQRYIWYVNVVVSILLMALYVYVEKSQAVVVGYALLGIVGVLLGVTDIFLFTAVPDVTNEGDSETGVFKTLAEPLRNSDFRRYTFFVCYWLFGVMLAAPSMGIYQLEFLKMEVWVVQLLLVVNTAGMALMSRFWGLLCDTYGQRPAIIICALGKAFIPLGFFFAPRNQAIAIPLLGLAMLFDGLSNGGMSIALQSYLFKCSPRAHRAMYISSSNFLMGIACAIAPVIAGKVIVGLNHFQGLKMGIYLFNGYHAVFLASFAFRLSSCWFAARLREPGSAPLAVVVSHICSTNPLKVTRAVYTLGDASDAATRTEACRTLQSIRSPLAISELITALEDTHQQVREAAADALGAIGTHEASEPLVRALVDGERGIQSPAARALGQIGGFTSLQALLANLRDLEPGALSATIESLEKIGDSAAILPLICLFGDTQDEALREKIATALGNLSETDSVAEVRSLLVGHREGHAERLGGA